MPWKESRPMDLRVQLIEDYEQGESIAALGRIYSVARKTIYKWLARHDAEGVAGLADRSRVPQHFPGKVSDEVVELIVGARQRWNWGPRKLRCQGKVEMSYRQQSRNVRF
jgi:putative transposase